MNHLREYIIPFGGLKIGNHTFDFNVDEDFFACFEGTELSQGRVKVTATMEKTERMLVFNFLIDGVVSVVCDRCAGEFDLEIGGEETLFVKFGGEAAEEDDDVLVLPHDENRIDLSAAIYDYISLLVPFRKIHPEKEDGTSGCDPEMLARIEALKPLPRHDPRWETLNHIDPEN